MPDNPKTIGIIVLVINLLVLGPTSWIIKNLRSDMIDQKELMRQRNDDLNVKMDNLAASSVDRASHELDIQQLKTRINTIKGRLYDLHITR